MEPISSLFDLTGKGAIVTGAARGLGKAEAMRLAEAGAKVMITDVDIDLAQETVAEIKVAGGTALAMTADGSSAVDAQRTVDATLEAFGNLYILVNNAGIYPGSRFLETSESLWDKVINLNLKGTWLYSQAAARAMVAAGQGGRIVNTASMGAFVSMGVSTHYDSSKAGVAMLTKDLAYELAQYRILVNAVAPGFILTPGVMGGPPLPAEVTAQATFKGPETIPLKYMGEPDHIAKAVLFLVSNAADYITGITLIVDGGYLTI
jgi:2-deoxy-D-gluconate 3-dehydrogenase